MPQSRGSVSRSGGSLNPSSTNERRPQSGGRQTDNRRRRRPPAPFAAWGSDDEGIQCPILERQTLWSARWERVQDQPGRHRERHRGARPRRGRDLRGRGRRHLLRRREQESPATPSHHRGSAVAGEILVGAPRPNRLLHEEARVPSTGSPSRDLVHSRRTATAVAADAGERDAEVAGSATNPQSFRNTYSGTLLRRLRPSAL